MFGCTLPASPVVGSLLGSRSMRKQRRRAALEAARRQGGSSVVYGRAMASGGPRFRVTWPFLHGVLSGPSKSGAQ